MKHGVKMKMLILVTLVVSTSGIDLHEPEGLDPIGFVSASPIIKIAPDRIAPDTTVTLAGSTTNSARRTNEDCNCDLEMCCNQDGPCRCTLTYKQLPQLECQTRGKRGLWPFASFFPFCSRAIIIKQRT